MIEKKITFGYIFKIGIIIQIGNHESNLMNKSKDLYVRISRKVDNSFKSRLVLVFFNTYFY